MSCSPGRGLLEDAIKVLRTLEVHSCQGVLSGSTFVCFVPANRKFDGLTPGTLNLSLCQEWPRQTKPKNGQFMNFSRGHSGTKIRCESRLFSHGETPEFTKMGEIHELFVSALSLVWFAGATPDSGTLNLSFCGGRGDGV